MFILIFEQLMKMFFILLLAFVCYKIGLVDQNGNKSVSNLLLMVVNPILIITVYQTDYDPSLVRGLLLAFAAAAAAHVLGIIISTLIIRPKSSNDYCIERINYPGASTQALCSAPTSPLTALAFLSCSRKIESGV